MARAEVRPIKASDLVPVGEFLHQHLNHRLDGSDWAQSISVPWRSGSPNHGFMLIDDGAIVGVYLAFYSNRTIGGRVENFCNLGAWCVLPRHRLHSLLLLRAILAQKGYHFTDLSPSGATISVNDRLKFVHLDTTTALLLNVPWPRLLGSVKVISGRAEIEQVLIGREKDIHQDHVLASAARHIVIVDGNEHCYVIFRRDRRKGVAVFASVLYVSNPGLFLRAARAISSHLLLRHGVVATLIECRIAGGRPAGTILLNKSRPKMFRSETLGPEQIDYLYSELVCVAW